MDPFKERLLGYCKSTVRRKIELISFSMDEIKGSMENETKSSAGDKHETARARMQSEYEKLSWQLDELKSQYEQVDKIDPARSTKMVAHQSLVYTDKGIFFIIIPLGKIEFEDDTVYVISPVSPLAKKMTGCSVEDKFEMNNVTYSIQRIL